MFDGQVSRACAFVEDLVGSQSIVGAAEQVDLDGAPPCRLIGVAQQLLPPCVDCIAKVGLPGIYLRDLRDAGNTLNADAGASPRELMDRMGRSSTRAALIQQRSSGERQRELPMRSAKLPARRSAR